MKVKVRNKALIGLISIILGIVIAMQFKMVNQAFLDGTIPFQRSEELTSTYVELLEERDQYKEEIIELENHLLEIEESISKDNVIVQNLLNELKFYKLVGGFSDVEGEGISIIIDNPPKDSVSSYDVNIIYEYDMLLLIINELNAAGAEAVEINGERIISLSEIRTAGNAISINSIPQYAPFTIKTIGNKETLEGAVIQRFGIISILRDKGYYIDVRKYDKIEIAKYSGNIEFNYAKTIKE